MNKLFIDLFSLPIALRSSGLAYMLLLDPDLVATCNIKCSPNICAVLDEEECGVWITEREDGFGSVV